MIRRQTGSQWLLITQNDHATFAGELAAHLGNHLFERPEDRESLVKAVNLHDSGWPLHDDQPTLNPHGQPLDVFETPSHIALKVWSASAERAAADDPRAGLLVSLHSLSLSIDATAQSTPKPQKFDVTNPVTRFELNKFQHRQVELQESLRKRLGLSTDLPLRQGLALESNLPQEEQLIFQFRLLQAMDALSLAACCTKPPTTQIRPVLARPGGRALSLRINRENDHTLHVSPWPFDVDQIQLNIPIRRFNAERFPDEQSFHQAYAAAPPDQLAMTILPRR